MGLKWSGERDGFQIWFQTWSLCKTTTTFVSLHTFYENVDFNNFIMILDEARMVFPDIPDLLLPPREMFLLSAEVLFFTSVFPYFCLCCRLWFWLCPILRLIDGEASFNSPAPIKRSSLHKYSLRCETPMPFIVNATLESNCQNILKNLEWNIFKCFFLLPFIVLQAWDAVFL